MEFSIVSPLTDIVPKEKPRTGRGFLLSVMGRATQPSDPSLLLLGLVLQVALSLYVLTYAIDDLIVHDLAHSKSEKRVSSEHRDLARLRRRSISLNPLTVSQG